MFSYFNQMDNRVMSFKQKFERLSRNRSFKYGLPFLICIVGGSFTLREFAQLKFQYNKKTLLRPDQVEQFGITMKPAKEVTLEKEFEKIQSLDIDNWENKRGPRPWEEEEAASK